MKWYRIWHIWERREMHNTKFWQENLKKREHLKDQSRWKDVEWIHLAQDGPVEGFSEPVIDSMSNHSLVRKDSALWRYSENGRKQSIWFGY